MAFPRYSPSATPAEATANSGSSGSSNLDPSRAIVASRSSSSSTAARPGREPRARDIVREVNDAGIKVNYDAGNVMDYLDVDPIPDLGTSVEEVRSFCIKPPQHPS